MFKKARTARVERAAHHACICACWKTVESSNATLLGIAFGRVDAASLATASFFSAISALRKYRGYIRTCTPRDTKTQIGYWLYLSYTHIRTHKSVAAHTSLSLHTPSCSPCSYTCQIFRRPLRPPVRHLGVRRHCSSETGEAAGMRNSGTTLVQPRDTRTNSGFCVISGPTKQDVVFERGQAFPS